MVQQIGSDSSREAARRAEIERLMREEAERRAKEAAELRRQRLLAAGDDYRRLSNDHNLTKVQFPTEQSQQTQVLGGGALSLFNEGPYADTVGNRMRAMLEVVARNEVQLYAAASPIPYDPVRKALQAQYEAVMLALKNADSYQSLQAALAQVPALLASFDQALRTATRAQGAERGLSFEGNPSYAALADPDTIGLLAQGAGFAPDPAEVSPAYKALVDSTIQSILAAAPAGYGGMTPEAYVIANFPRSVRQQLDAIIANEILGQTFTVTLDPPGDVSYQLVAMDTWALHDYVAAVVDADGNFSASQFGADISVSFAQANMGIGPSSSYASVAQGVPPFTWDPTRRELRDSQGTLIKPNLIFSSGAQTQ